MLLATVYGSIHGNGDAASASCDSGCAAGCVYQPTSASGTAAKDDANTYTVIQAYCSSSAHAGWD